MKIFRKNWNCWTKKVEKSPAESRRSWPRSYPRITRIWHIRQPGINPPCLQSSLCRGGGGECVFLEKKIRRIDPENRASQVGGLGGVWRKMWGENKRGSNNKMTMKPFESKIWLSSPTMHGPELEYIKEAYDTNWMSTVGKNINEAERLACEQVGCKYAVALSAGTAALHMAVKLAGVKPGDKVLAI